MTLAEGITIIADELTGAMFRLAGAKVVVAEPRTLARDFDAAREDSALVMITAEFAAHLSPATLEEALLAVQPLTMVMADVRGRVRLPDLVSRTRRILGVEA